MKRLEFDKLVNQKKKDLLKQDAQEVFNKLNNLYLYRKFGIEFYTLDEIFTEIAQAEILGIEFVDNININEEIKTL
tara:strand:- start:805 stop:1032 length:228 start_codon:yes stop_codon:yes gene_type:complete